MEDLSDEEIDYYASLERRKNYILNSDISPEIKENLLRKVELDKKMYDLSRKQINLINKRSEKWKKIIENNEQCLKNTKIIDGYLKEELKSKTKNFIEKYYWEKNKFWNFSKN